MLRIDFDQKETDNLIKTLDVTKKEINKACVLAAEKTAEWIKDTVGREIVNRTPVTNEVVWGRTKKYPGRGRILGKFWIGVRRVKLGRLNPEKVNGGVRVGKLFVEGAFIARLRPNLPVGVYKRKYKTDMPGKPHGFPVLTQYLRFDEEAEKIIKDDILNQVQEKIIENVKEELQWVKSRNS